VTAADTVAAAIAAAADTEAADLKPKPD
jgi:hypothetical protein